MWENVYSLQEGLKNRGFDIGNTQSCVTPVYLKEAFEAMVLVKDLKRIMDFLLYSSLSCYTKGTNLVKINSNSVTHNKDIEITLDAFSSIREKLQNGTYKTMSEVIPAL